MVQTRSSKPPAPYHRIWELSEILEAILIQLPVKDMLRCQRVCSGWHSILTHSPCLQEEQFFRPQKRTGAERQDAGGVRCVLNPLLVEKFPLWFMHDTARRRFGYDTFANLPWAKKSAARNAFLKREASWRRMLVAQPPPTIFEFVEGSIGMLGSSLGVAESKPPDGVRMGLVYDHAEDVLSTNTNLLCVVIDGEIVGDRGRYVERRAEDAERYFGGEHKYTLVLSTSHGCVLDLEPEKIEFPRPSFTSAGRDLVKMELSYKERPANHDPHYWWTSEGYTADLPDL